MKEKEWLTCADPRPMLTFLRDKASDRKLRLFTVACCCSVSKHLRDKRSREALVVAESFADGLLGKQELAGARKEAKAALYCATYGPEAWATRAVFYVA
jgi:hypothetical protein